MLSFTVALWALALSISTLALPRPEVELLEQLRGIPDGWMQVVLREQGHMHTLTPPTYRVLPLQLPRDLNSKLPFVNRDRSILSKWSLTCQLPATELMVST